MSDQTLREWLAELEAQHARDAVVIAKVRAALEMEGDAPVSPTVPSVGQPPVSTGRIASDTFFRLSIPEAIKKFLAIKKQPQSPTSIVEGLQSGGMLTNAKSFYSNVTTALKRLRVAGEVVLTPNGWGLDEWYPNRAKATDDRQKNKKSHAKATKTKGSKGRPSKAAPPDRSSKAPTLDEVLGTAPAPHGYRAFVGEQMKTGKSMSEAAAAWKSRNNPS